MADDLRQSARPPLGVIDGVTNEFDHDLFSIFIQSVNPQIFRVLFLGKHSAIFICGRFEVRIEGMSESGKRGLDPFHITNGQHFGRFMCRHHIRSLSIPLNIMKFDRLPICRDPHQFRFRLHVIECRHIVWSRSMDRRVFRHHAATLNQRDQSIVHLRRQRLVRSLSNRQRLFLSFCFYTSTV